MTLDKGTGPDPLPVHNLLSPIGASVSRWAYLAIRCTLHFERDAEIGRLLRLSPEQVRRLREIEDIEEPA